MGVTGVFLFREEHLQICQKVMLKRFTHTNYVYIHIHMHSFIENILSHSYCILFPSLHHISLILCFHYQTCYLEFQEIELKMSLIMFFNGMNI